MWPSPFLLEIRPSHTREHPPYLCSQPPLQQEIDQCSSVSPNSQGLSCRIGAHPTYKAPGEPLKCISSIVLWPSATGGKLLPTPTHFPPASLLRTHHTEGRLKLLLPCTCPRLPKRLSEHPGLHFSPHMTNWLHERTVSPRTAAGECFSLAERKEMKWVSHFSIRFLLVTTAEPDYVQKIESQLVADGRGKWVVAKTQWRHKKGHWHY